VVTYEFENVDYDAASYIEQQGKLPQGAEALAITQHRARERELLETLKLPTAPFKIVETAEECEEAFQSVSIPAVVKTCRGGYDGKGQLKVDTKEDIAEAMAFVQEAYPCIVEEWIPFDKEISVVFTRGINGDITFFPLAENVHVHHILHTTIAPAQVNDSIKNRAIHAAERIAEEMNIVGTFAIEMFVVGEEMYINEMAPRPHNSGHYTIEACNISQFNQHIRGICGLPLIPVKQYEHACMVNVLGEHMDRALDTLAKDDGSFVHLYGKAEAKSKRKMGHITWLGKDIQHMREKAIPFEEDVR
ncbi:MAG TPA: 5-(carboxyamino)imidazole ribonucleotide synthase, partial [Bacillota bacterium]|nr:5-(carboxyamino)imidazole ribonucleotide synthase [Bacillota bacterium]